MEASASLELAKHVLLMFGTILAVGTFSGLIARLVRLPDVVVFLLVGMLLGPGVSGIVNIRADSTINQLILIFGSSHPVRRRRLDPPQGVERRVDHHRGYFHSRILVTATITGVAAWYFLGLAPVLALLLGTVIASTDPATLVPVFKQVRVKDRVRTDRDERISVQRRDGRDTHFYRVGRGNGRGRVFGRRCRRRPA